ncbi:hypothetical protein [Pseudomonas fragariae (ex Marin et al. 2024)]|uniref:hypothetical protein n=1 Tax=Pseudomonas fragariae (ex Marin et al. 2024) TaxID=3080056 RepID=UPI003F7A2B7F
MTQSDLAGGHRYSSEPVEAATRLNPQQQQTFDTLLGDIAQTADYAALRQAVGRSQGFALGLFVCQMINAEQQRLLEGQINEANQKRFDIIMPLDDPELL